MKKIIALILAALMLFSIVACGSNDLAAAAKEIERITGEKTTVEDVQEIIDGLELFSDEKVTAADAVEFVREMYELSN